MKLKNTSGLLTIFAALLSLSILSGCFKDSIKKTRTYTYTMLTPVYKTRAEVFGAMNSNPNEKITSAGKIYIKDRFIYLNEVDKGVHIIDNNDPANPQQIAFLDIPGNRDMAVKGNILYADMYGDLLAIDISNPKQTTVKKEIRNFFQYRTYANPAVIDNNLVVVDWIRKDTTITTTETNYYPGDCYNCFYLDAASYAQTANSGGIKPGASGNGLAGSMASMVLMNNYLYAIREPHSIGIVNIATAAEPSLDTTFYAGFDLETIYPFENKLFLGSMTGMYMYDLADPLVPVKLGEFSHGRACDPVVTDGAYAYVTLHAGANCGGSANELHIVDIADLMNPILVKSYQLTKPTGLCKDGDMLFICDGTSGVRLYDVSDVSNLKQLKQIDVNDSYDVIAANGLALVVAKDGLYQYDYSNIDNIRLLSRYSISNN